jgi:kynureninase
VTAPSREAAAALDAADPLAGFRARFEVPDGVIYLDGNSLGMLPTAAAARAHQVIHEQWGRDLIRAWNAHGWIDLPAAVGAKIATLIGAAPDEVVAADSTSVNLFKLLAAAVRLRPGRPTILSEADNFPTDSYVAEGLCDLLDGRVALRLVGAGELEAALDERVALLSLTHVDYRSGRMHDMAALTAAAHAAGALVLWDLSHSAGAVALDLAACEADFAVGCGYKYLNGGPGAPAYLYVARRLQHGLRQPLTGWMGHAAPFDFAARYRPAEGIGRALCGTPSVVALAMLEASLEVILEAGMAAIRAKSLALSDLFMALVEETCGGLGLTPISPTAHEQRGSQVAYRHAHGYPAMQALIARGVIGDFRRPDVMRFGFAPLYLRHTEVWDAVAALRAVLADEAWRHVDAAAAGPVI